jgi:hypothetical protein
MASLAVVLAIAWSSSRARLHDDRARYLEAFLPVAYAQGGCGPGLTLERTADGHLDLSARAVPLADVLRCLVERAGLRVEYDGPPPRQPVTVALRGESLAGTLESLLAGLGMNYLLGRDPSGTVVDRLIVFGASRATESNRGGSAGASPAGVGQPVEPLPAEPSAEDEAPVFEMPTAAPPEFPPSSSVPPPDAEPSPGVHEPGGAPEPPLVEPEELTPMTLQLGRGAYRTANRPYDVSDLLTPSVAS